MNSRNINSLFHDKLRVINMGLQSFGDTLKERQVEVLQMEWRPPAGGDEKIIALLKKIGR